MSEILDQVMSAWKEKAALLRTCARRRQFAFALLELATQRSVLRSEWLSCRTGSLGEGSNH